MEKSYTLADNLLHEASLRIRKIGIKGWEGHIHLSKGELYFQQGLYQEATHHFTQASTIHKSIQQEWGYIQANIGLERCRTKGEAGSLEPVTYWSEKANELHYQLQVKQANETASGITEIIIALPFL
ncbi:hypothetical protein [Ornithinibacillus halotolerans]|uniref:Tetratricopeptide repeat protein n=1 Tax=Ornithinibacillus halotolerans TaxID=1274357 RepID=A0A916RQ76_9BACI|nr:hypothetical protein [Ornithinibacillus halotolerans]GGA65779.1 hypothetical protein GCM10008025_06990 [Ornithinibacillus halotolerans]